MVSTLQAFAQTPVPGAAEPGRIPAPLQRPPEPLSHEAPLVIHPGAPTIAPLGAGNYRFTLRRVVLEGGTVYAPSALAVLYRGKIGRVISAADVYAIADAISVKYRNDGYLLSQAVVPPQRIRGGVIRIRIVEGYVGHVRVVGAVPSGSDYIQRIADKITRDRPLRAATLERYLLLINDLPGVTAQSALRAAGLGLGAAELIMTVGQKTVDGSLGFDNRAGHYFDDFEANGGFGLNSLFGQYERFSARLLASTDWRMRYADLGATLPVGTEGLKFQLRGLFGEDHPGESLAPLDIHDSSYLVSAGGDYPIIRSRQENWRVSGEFDVRDTTSDVRAVPARAEDALRVLRLGTTYDRTDTLTGLVAVNLVSAQLSQGLDFLGASEPGPSRTRTDGRPGFTKLNFYVSRDQPLVGPFSVYLAGAAQASPDPLFFSEAFGIGGPQFGRAYDPSEILGDSGVAGSAELRYTGIGDGVVLRSFQLFTYVDGGTVYNNGALQPGLVRNASLVSAGVGLRANLTHGFAGEAEFDFPLDRVVQSLGDRDPRAFFSVEAQF
jgi:hemolysin activation/secretion protein